MDLHDKVVLITGGTRMGAAVAKAFAGRGASVVLTWRSSRQTVEGLVEEFRRQGVPSAAFRCDLTREPDLKRLVAQIAKKFRRLDVVVNLASIYGSEPLLGGNAGRSWDANLNANAKGGYLLSIAAAPLLKRSGAGRIIHVADWTAASGRPRYKDFSPYYVSKAAVKATVEALALELAPEVLVNGIAPGPILPPAGMTRKEYGVVVEATPLKRWGGAGEIARTALFLAETEFVTGEVIRVDGGRHLY